MGAQSYIDREIFDSVVTTVTRALAQRTSVQVFVTGSPGMGKTTLLDTVAKSITGISVLRADADETDSRTSYSVAERLFAVPDAVEHRQLDHRAGAHRLCAVAPTVLMVDDAHLADRESLDLLHELMIATDTHGVVMVIAYVPFPPRTALTRMKAAAPQGRSMRIGPYTSAEISDLARSHPANRSPDALREILAETGGNPRLVSRLLEYTGPTLDATLCALDDRVRAYLELLDPTAREVVHIVAAVGGPVSVGELAEIRTQNPAVLTEPLFTAVGAGLLKWTESGDIDCASEMYRRAVLHSVPDGLRTLIESAIAEGLARAGSQPERVVRHREFVAQRSGSKHVVALPTMGMFDPSALADSVDSEPGLVRAIVLAESGRLQDAATAAATVLRRTTTPQSRLVLWLVLLSNSIFAPDIDRCKQLVAEMRRYSLPAEAAEWLELLPRWLDLLSGAPATVDHGRGAQNTPPLPGFTLDTIIPGISETVVANCVAGLAIFEQGEKRNRRDSCFAPERPLQGVWARWAARYSYGPNAALSRRVIAAAAGKATMADMWLEPMHHSVEAEILYALGRFGHAYESAAEALARAERIGWGWTSTAATTAALVRTHQGDLAGAEDALGSDGPAPDLFGFPDREYARAELLSARGQHTEAADLARRAWEKASHATRYVWLLSRAPQIARIAAQASDPELRALVQSDLRSLSAAECPALFPGADLVAAMASGDHLSAADCARRFAAFGDAVGELAATEEAACLAAAHGLREAARPYAHRALRLGTDIGSVTTQNRIRARLRDLGVRLGSTGKRNTTAVMGWDALTASEQRVARLLGSGSTSSKVSAELGISKRTVQTHVSNALVKLGFTSRAQLAAEAARRDHRASHSR